MKILTLNFKKWKCGQDGDENVAHGRGGTKLLNNEGYMCCLGQFATQLNPKVKKQNILHKHNPCDLSEVIPALSKKFGHYSIIDTKLSNAAIDINDDENTFIEQKIKKLKSLFRKRGYTIKVTNLPKTLQKKFKNKQ